MIQIFFFSGNDALYLSNILCMKLNTVNIWFAINKLSLNVSKTNKMIFGNKKINCDINICISGISINIFGSNNT